MNYITTILIALVVFLAIDFLWLGIIAKGFYEKHLGHIFADKFKMWPAFVFYPLYAAGLAVFVLKPSLNQGYSLLQVFLLGAFFGIIAYGTYNLTNFITIGGWPLKGLLVDISWGGFVTGTTSMITYYLVSLI